MFICEKRAYWYTKFPVQFGTINLMERICPSAVLPKAVLHKEGVPVQLYTRGYEAQMSLNLWDPCFLICLIEASSYV